MFSHRSHGVVTWSNLFRLFCTCILKSFQSKVLLFTHLSFTEKALQGRMLYFGPLCTLGAEVAERRTSRKMVKVLMFYFVLVSCNARWYHLSNSPFRGPTSAARGEGCRNPCPHPRPKSRRNRWTAGTAHTLPGSFPTRDPDLPARARPVPEPPAFVPARLHQEKTQSGALP